MKETTKSTAKKKNSPKEGKPGVQTITCMFKRQYEAKKISSASDASSSSTKEGDRDVYITHIQKASEYFSPKGRTAKPLNRLSLRRNRTKENNAILVPAISTESTLHSTGMAEAVIDQTETYSQWNTECSIKPPKNEALDKSGMKETWTSLSTSSSEYTSKKVCSPRKRKSSQKDDINSNKKGKTIQDENFKDMKGNADSGENKPDSISMNKAEMRNIEDSIEESTQSHQYVLTENISKFDLLSIPLLYFPQLKIC